MNQVDKMAKKLISGQIFAHLSQIWSSRIFFDPKRIIQTH